MHVWLVDRQHSAFDLVSQPGKVSEVSTDIGCLDCGFGQELAAVSGLQPREPLGVLFHKVGKPEQEMPSIRLGQIAPGRILERPAGRSHGLTDIFGCRTGKGRPVLAISRILRCHHLRGSTFGPGSVDIELKVRSFGHGFLTQMPASRRR